MAKYFLTRHTISAWRPSICHSIQEKVIHSNFSWRGWRKSMGGVHYSTDVSREKNVKNVENSSQFSTNGGAGSKKAAIRALRALTKTYDFLTYPIYTLIQKPGERLAQHNTPKAKRIGTNEWISIAPRSVLSGEMIELKIDTLDKAFDHAMSKYGNRRCLGTRPVLSYVDVEGGSGGPMRKFELGDYQWKTYDEVKIMAETLSKNMQNILKLKNRQMISIFADTREEWLLTAFAAYKANLAVATIFTALGDEGVIHAVNETEVSCLFTSEDLMPRLYQLLKVLPHLKNIVYMDKPGSGFKLDRSKIPPHVTVQPFSLFLETPPQETEETISRPKPQPNDTAIVMYTSGSTGVPKGVEISHVSIVMVIMGCSDALDACYEDYERYIAYLPLAHIFEFLSESKTLLHGNKIGYGHPLTITDMSPGLKEGSKGDATLLQPTIMVSVPLILERISKIIHLKLKEKGGLAPDIFDYFCQYKMEWVRRGYETPLVDKIIFKKIRQIIGGKVKLLVCGGAAIAEPTQELCRTILCNTLLTGFGLTESSGTATASIVGDLSVGRAGSVIHGCKIRVVDWEEGGYRVSDKPYPRGELYVGGPTVAKGYFKRENTPEAAAFFIEDGVQWVKTGDICEVDDAGSIRIIDRKKDLVKLSSGEFISLGRIESMLKICPIVENACVYATSLLPSPVAIVVPSQMEVENTGKELGIKKSYEELAQDPQVVQNILTKLQQHGRQSLLSKSEIPQAIYLSTNLWTPQSGLVTASLKLKRANLYATFKSQLEELSLRISSV